MSRVENQRRLFLELMQLLRPLWHSDPAQPRLLANWLAAHRAGSRDRKLYRELAYTSWRTIPDILQFSDDDLIAHVANSAEEIPATAPFIAAFRPTSPASPAADLSLLPAWLAKECPATISPPHLQSLLSRAPLWIRLQTDDHQSVSTELTELQIAHTPSPVVGNAWKIDSNAPLQNTTSFRRGLFEIQDIGSQSLLHSIAEPWRGHWLDACAGAGGKTLQLAQLLAKTGRVTAHDIRFAALQELEQRVNRAQLENVAVETEPEGTFDGVLVDAPCSGSGTWRRAPHLKWTTNLAGINRAATRQLELLNRFSTHVAPGGLLVYATCSLCRTENESVVDEFSAANSQFHPLPLIDVKTGSVLETGRLNRLPADLDSDAYFVAGFRRASS